ncbi:MAG: cache domain-containing protein [Alphaproteobacteria bacterium]|nr:cache domain-containing protein [Alphaproteobacteria bacterium]
MKAWKTIVAALMFAAALSFAQANAAGTPEDAQALAEKAAGLVKAEGDKAFATLSDPNGGYVQGELYVTVLDRQGVVRANINQKVIGVNMWEAKDPDGTLFTQEAWKVVASSESGWTRYKYVNPTTKKIEAKKAWVHKVGDYVVLCGAYVAD